LIFSFVNLVCDQLFAFILGVVNGGIGVVIVVVVLLAIDVGVGNV
jgi:hypothetical protein